MNKEEIISQGNELLGLLELAILRERFEVWKDTVLDYARYDNDFLSQCKLQLHVWDTAFEPNELVIQKYKESIKRTLEVLKKQNMTGMGENALESLIGNFDLLLKYLFRTKPENRASIDDGLLRSVEINNEYDVQHIMYAVVKALYPSARREVNQDTGYGTVRYDISIKDIDTVIEIKCTRTDHTEKKLLQELGEDAYFYKCSKLIMYIYDKTNVIKDVNNFRAALCGTKEQVGKEVVVFVEQQHDLV